MRLDVLHKFTKKKFCTAEHGLHNWLNTRPGGKDDIAAMSLIDNDSNTSVILIDQSVSTLHVICFVTYLHCNLYDIGT